MKPIFSLSAVAVFFVFVIVPSPCLALGSQMDVSKEEAKTLGMEVRSEEVNGNPVEVELEFKTEGDLKNFSGVNLLIGEGDNPAVIAPLKEDRTKPGHVVVSFYADRAQLDKITLAVTVSELGNQVYKLRIKDFVELKKNR